MTKADQISSQILENLTESEGFISEFCRSCPLITREYGHDFCPVDFMPSDRDCARQADWGYIEAAAMEIGEITGNV